MTPRPDPGSAGSPLDVLRDFMDCPYIDAVDPGIHSGCRYCAEREKRGVPEALAAVERLVEAAREREREEGTVSSLLLDALAPFEETARTFP